jgi:hypothetical protein
MHFLIAEERRPGHDNLTVLHSLAHQRVGLEYTIVEVTCSLLVAA